MWDGGPQCIIWRMSGQSTPMPNAMVAMTICSDNGDVNLFMMSFVDGWVQWVNMSTSLNCAKSSMPTGSVKERPRQLLKYLYTSQHSWYVLQKMMVCSMFSHLSHSLITTGDRDCSISNFLIKKYIYVWLIGWDWNDYRFIHIQCFNYRFSCVNGSSGSQCHYLHLFRDDTSNFIYMWKFTSKTFPPVYWVSVILLRV